ncbi:MAG: O-antigen ligase family protein, partial [Desulfovibrio sp.]|nr:O-antigen ligase family protein [Desulfovibrio sp.]
FWLSLALFPIGYGFREVMPPICLIFLGCYYRCDWQNSVLKRLGKTAWLFGCAAGMTLIGVIFSIHPQSSFLHACMGLNKAYILPFIAMECATSLADLKRLAWACALACFWQGLDGLWQAFTGHDFIMGYGYAGRLTGSLGDYTVGNYLALALVPAFGVWFILAARLPLSACAFTAFALLWPAAFLFLGASSRSAILAVTAALGLWAIMRKGIKNLAWLCLPGCAAAIFLFFQAGRFAPQAVISDNRWDLWRLAWQVFQAHPWLGAGAGQYNAAFRELGLAPVAETITISHPHDLYLDMLYAHGLIGFGLGMVFLLGFLLWGGLKIWPKIRAADLHTDKGLYWILAAWFWLGYLAWLVNGIFGHDFYRIWWLALAMCNMGVMIGAVVSGLPKDIDWDRNSRIS